MLKQPESEQQQTASSESSTPDANVFLSFMAVPDREPLSEVQIDFLESQIPVMAQAATQAAFWNTLTRGHSVVCAEGDDLVEIAPDGTRRFIKTLEPNVPFFEEGSSARP